MTEIKLATILAMLIATLWRPTHATCPRGWFVDGAQRVGTFECAQRSDAPDFDVVDAGFCVRSRLYCTSGAVAVASGTSVWCQRVTDDRREP